MPNNFTVSSSVPSFTLLAAKTTLWEKMGMYTAIYCGAANFGGIVYRKFWGEGKKNGEKYGPVICFLLPMALHASQIAMQAV